MRHFHFSVSSVQRSNGHSAVASAAYQARDRLVRDETLKSYDYSGKKEDIAFSKLYKPEITLPWSDKTKALSKVSKKNFLALQESLKKNESSALSDKILALGDKERFEAVFSAGEVKELKEYLNERANEKFSWAVKDNILSAQREVFWNAVEARENRKNSILSRNFVLSLPVDLGPKDWERILDQFVKKEFTDKGFAADLNIHIDKHHNPHAHIQSSVRTLDEQGWSKGKDRLFADFKASETVYKLRCSFAEITNEFLKKQGLELVDPRSYKDQGVELTPGVHLGKALHGMMRKGADYLQGTLGWEKAQKSAQIASLNAYRLRQDPNMLIRDLEKKKDVFSCDDVKKYLARITTNQDEYRDLLRVFFKEADTLVRLGSDGPQRFYTSISRIKSLKEFRVLKNELLNNQSSFVFKESKEIERYINSFKVGDNHLTEPQKEALKYLFTDKSPLKNVVGYAGVGKSSLTKAYVDKMQQAGKTIVAVAPTGLAAKNLEKDCGLKALTLDSYTQKSYKDLEKNLTLGLKKDSVILVDEASMVSNDKIHALLKIAQQYRSQIVFLGDPKQLEAISGNHYYQEICLSRQCKVDKVVRQNAPWMGKASEEMGKGNLEKALSYYLGNYRGQDSSRLGYKGRAENRLSIYKNFEKTTEALLGAWSSDLSAENLDKRIILASKRNAVDVYNDKARDICVAKGLVSSNGVDVKVKEKKDFQYKRNEGLSALVYLFQRSLGTVLKNSLVQSSLDKKSKESTKTFAKGDRVIFLQNDRDLGLQNGLTGVIDSIDKKAMKVSIASSKNEKEKDGILQSLKSFFGFKSPDSKVESRQVTVHFKDYNYFNHAYARTVHKSQGLSIDKVFFHVSQSYENRNLTTVALTRHTKDIKIFAQDFKKSLSSVISRITHRDSSALALMRGIRDNLGRKLSLEQAIYQHERHHEATLKVQRGENVQQRESGRGRGGRGR